MEKIVSFNTRVNSAVKIVQEQYPETALYEAGGKAISGPTTDPNKIEELRVVFNNVNDTTVIIKETSFGEFGKPELLTEPWTGDIIIQWPVKMDLPQANILKEEAGYTDPYEFVILRNPLGPILTNPFFIFRGNSDVFVDTVTGEVYSSH